MAHTTPLLEQLPAGAALSRRRRRRRGILRRLTPIARGQLSLHRAKKKLKTNDWWIGFSVGHV